MEDVTLEEQIYIQVEAHLDAIRKDLIVTYCRNKKQRLLREVFNNPEIASLIIDADFSKEVEAEFDRVKESIL